MTSIIHEQKVLSLKNACVEFMFAYQQRNVEKMLSFCDPEGVVFFEPLGKDGQGKIYELGKAIWSGLIESFPNLDNTLDAAVATDENTVQCQVIIRGTQSKDFADIPNNGQSFDSDHIFIFRLGPDNKIQHIHINWNHADFKKQLGTES